MGSTRSVVKSEAVVRSQFKTPLTLHLFAVLRMHLESARPLRAERFRRATAPGFLHCMACRHLKCETATAYYSDGLRSPKLFSSS